MANPVLVRDPFHKGLWRLYVPTNRNGYYVQYDIVEARAGYNAVCRIGAGRVCVGKVYPANSTIGANEFVKTGNWGNTNNGSFYYAQSPTVGSTAKVVIPAGHNRIHALFVSHATSGGTAAFDWDDGTTTGLDITSYSTMDASYAVKEVAIATNANPNGIKALRLTVSSATVRFIGFRSWNTSLTGTPQTTNGSGIWMGHSFISTKNTAWTTTDVPVGNSYVQISNAAAALDFAMRWKHTASGSSAQFSGGYAHLFPSDNAEFVYTAGSSYLTDGAHVIIDGVDTGGLYQMSMCTVRTGSKINLQQTGFFDFDGDGTNNDAAAGEGADPTVYWCTGADETSIHYNWTIRWNAAATITENNAYCPMCVLDGLSGDFYVLTNNSKTKILKDTLQIISGSTKASIWAPRNKLLINFETQCQIKDLLWDNGISKLYLRNNLKQLIGGLTPSAGTLWQFGGRVSIEYPTTQNILQNIYGTYSRGLLGPVRGLLG